MKKKGERESFDIPPAAPVPNKGGGKTIVGENISIEGTIRGSEDLVIDGSVKGNIELKGFHLTVGTKGKVEAEVNAENLTIGGELNGNVNVSDKVEITKEAKFNGEIKAKRLAVEDGAYLKAVIDLEQGSEKKSSSQQKSGEPLQSGAGKEHISLSKEGANKQ